MLRVSCDPAAWAQTREVRGAGWCCRPLMAADHRTGWGAGGHER